MFIFYECEIIRGVKNLSVIIFFVNYYDQIQDELAIVPVNYPYYKPFIISYNIKYFFKISPHFRQRYLWSRKKNIIFLFYRENIFY